MLLVRGRMLEAAKYISFDADDYRHGEHGEDMEIAEFGFKFQPAQMASLCPVVVRMQAKSRRQLMTRGCMKIFSSVMILLFQLLFPRVLFPHEPGKDGRNTEVWKFDTTPYKTGLGCVLVVCDTIEMLWNAYTQTTLVLKPEHLKFVDQICYHCMHPPYWKPWTFLLVPVSIMISNFSYAGKAFCKLEKGE